MQKIAILGFGAEGRSVLKFLRSQREYRGSQITILDRNASLKIPRGVQSILGSNYLNALDPFDKLRTSKFDLVFRSPGVPYELPELQAARAKGVRFSSATKLFLKHAKGTIIGVTGTKGKGTTATLIYKIMSAKGGSSSGGKTKKDVYLVGNIGKPALDILPKLTKTSIVVFELSSFQLQDLDISPHIAVVLDIFPDHMDAHSNFAEYLDAKSSIAKFQTGHDRIFFSAHNEYAKGIAAQSKGKQIPVTVDDWSLFHEDDLLIKGPHNMKNAVMAATVAQSLGVSDKIILKTVRAFKGLPYRLQIIKAKKNKNIKIRERGDILFVNDSAGTNPSTAAAAIRSFTEPIFLICGGKDKNVSFDPLRDAVKHATNIKGIFLIGENAKKISESLQSVVSCQLSVVSTLRSAVIAAYRAALQPNTPACRQAGINLSPVILFSPASASFDMFKDYKDRGEQFKKIVRSL